MRNPCKSPTTVYGALPAVTGFVLLAIVAVPEGVIAIFPGAAPQDEQDRLEHRLISFVPVTETFSAGQFAALAHAEIDALLDAGRRPIVVGGTGLYLQAALTDLELRPPPPPGVRERIVAAMERRGPEALHVELAERAPAAAAAVKPTGPTPGVGP